MYLFLCSSHFTFLPARCFPKHPLRPPKFQSSGPRRSCHRPSACALPRHPAPDVPTEDLVTDDQYVVLDGSDVSRLIEELQNQGDDQLGSYGDDSESASPVLETFLNFAERRSDEWEGRPPSSDFAAEAPVASAVVDKEQLENLPPMKYFQDEHVEYMPSWLAEAYSTGEYTAFEEEADSADSQGRTKRLQDIVERKRGVGNEFVGVDGIVDCTVADVAEDYGLPVEFVVDALLHIGVERPIMLQQSVRDCMTTEEIHRLVKLVGSFDAPDLADRYSDRSIREVAEDYDLHVQTLMDVCEKEGFFLCSKEETRLSLLKEDRILDILLRDAPYGQEYPSPLEGLE
eukprot:GFKZ01002367.1.p1 GENE.GFKZ01002367.1~~GFKZ01002367.1.p1  ORF type:complete len:344 (+),score=51.33 GFKZ01002367.1:164-1195(+)